MPAVSSENKNAATDAEKLRHSICPLSSLVQFFSLICKYKKIPPPTPSPTPPNANVSASNYPCRAAGQSCVRRLGGRWTVTCDRKRPSSARGCGEVTTSGSASWWGCASKKRKKEERDETIEHSLRPPPVHQPQQRHVPLNNGHFDQRGIPALCPLLSLSSHTHVNWSEGWTAYWIFSAGHTDYNTMGSHAVSVMCVLKHPTTAVYTDMYSHATHTDTQRTRSTTVTPGAGGAWTRIGSGPAVGTPANGREGV